jgi:hypothetical protein
VTIGSEIYKTLVRYAEGGERVVKVVLPKKLYAEYLDDGLIQSTMRILKVEVEEGEVVTPQFHKGEIK